MCVCVCVCMSIKHYEDVFLYALIVGFKPLKNKKITIHIVGIIISQILDCMVSSIICDFVYVFLFYDVLVHINCDHYVLFVHS